MTEIVRINIICTNIKYFVYILFITEDYFQEKKTIHLTSFDFFQMQLTHSLRELHILLSLIFYNQSVFLVHISSSEF